MATLRQLLEKLGNLDRQITALKKDVREFKKAEGIKLAQVKKGERARA